MCASICSKAAVADARQLLVGALSSARRLIGLQYAPEIRVEAAVGVRQCCKELRGFGKQLAGAIVRFLVVVVENALEDACIC